MKKQIKVFVMDVDGTMTDGKIYMGANGEVLKAFDIKDGYGIHEILPEHGVITAILTGRNSEIVKNRARELEINYVLQNVKDKGKAIQNLSEKLGYDMSQFAYMGDDIIDISAMKMCGITGCPFNASREVKRICDYISPVMGGNGAVRDFIEWLLDKELI